MCETIGYSCLFFFFSCLGKLESQAQTPCLSLSRTIKVISQGNCSVCKAELRKVGGISSYGRDTWSYLQILSYCCQLENLAGTQIKRDKARAGARGKTRHLRISLRRLDEDPSTGTLDTADTSLRDCPELDLSESRANNSCWAQQTEPHTQEAALPIRN